MKAYIPYIIIVLLLIYIGISKHERCSAVAPRDTVTYVDTIPYYNPVPKDSVVVRYVTEKLPVVSESVPNIADSVPKISNSVQNDSASVQIPITQKVYEDSTYKAYVSGFRPNLDSIYVFPKRQVVTLRPKPHRWHIGPSIGVGITTKGFQPTLGVTITYSIFSW